MSTCPGDQVHTWDVAKFKARKVLVTEFGSIHSIALSRRYIIIGTYNRNIHLYDIVSHEHCNELRGHLGTVHALTTSVDGKILFSASLDACVNIWNLENGLLVRRRPIRVRGIQGFRS